MCRCCTGSRASSTSTSFEDLASAQKFQKYDREIRAGKALKTLGADPEFSAVTVREWIEHHIGGSWRP